MHVFLSCHEPVSLNELETKENFLKKSGNCGQKELEVVFFLFFF